MTNNTANNSDLLIVGGGVSGLFTMIGLIDQAIASEKKIDITLVDDADEPFLGVAYGTSSGKSTLILTKLKDFFPQEELTKFGRWLYQSDLYWQKSSVYSLPIDRQENANDFIDLIGEHCVKRALIGQYFKERAKNAIDKGHSSGLVSVTVIPGSVTSIVHGNSRGTKKVQVLRTTGDSFTYMAGEVILCIGRLPSRAIPQISPGTGNGTLVQDPYESNIDDIISSVAAEAESSTQSGYKIAIVGANASALEVLYLISLLDKAVKEKLSIDIISMQGKLPTLNRSEKMQDEKYLAEVDTIVANVASAANGSAERTYKNVLNLLEEFKTSKIPFAIYNSAIDAYVQTSLVSMSDSEKLEYARAYGNLIGRYKRRIESNYNDAVLDLMNSGMSSVTPGRVTGYSYANDEICLEIVSEQDCSSRSGFDAVINCSGAEELSDQISRPLIKELLATQKIKPITGYSCGVEVDSSFKTGGDIYVMGPLLAGNVLNGSVVWHMEHCGRIIAYSRDLASILLEFQLPVVQSSRLTAH